MARPHTDHVSSLSFLISYSGSVFTKCWTTTPNTTIQNILLQTCIWNVQSSNLVWSATVHLLNTPFCNNAISNLQWLLNPCVRFFIPFHIRHLTCPYLSHVMCCPPPCKFFILFARNSVIKQPHNKAKSSTACLLELAYFFFCGVATQRGSWPPHSWGF